MTAPLVFENWVPDPDLSVPFYVEGLLDDWEGFRILLRTSDPMRGVFRITFGAAFAYRNTDESHLLRTWSQGWSGHQLVQGCGLLRTAESPWIDEFHAETHNIHRDESITHYAVFTGADCVEVLSRFEPTVEWL